MSNIVEKEEILNVLNDAIYQHDLRMIAKLIRLIDILPLVKTRGFSVLHTILPK